MIGLGVWQALLDGIGWVLAWIYDVIPNYGIAIIILTILIRLVLLPLGIKQIKSMQHMQAIQPKIKELQKKYKSNKQKQQEETMKLYREAGVNPLGGCLPLLLQFPILIAMYSVLRAPVPNANVEAVRSGAEPEYVNNHLPTDSRLYEDVTQHNGGGTSFLFMNLQCSLVQAGTQAQVSNSAGDPAADPQTGQPVTLDCGDSKFPAVIPYGALLLVMIGTTFYQQRQMQKASPPNAQSAQQQAIMKFLPLMFAFFGLSFPAGLVLYWTSSNAFQIAQQSFLLRAGHIGPDALEKRMAEQRARQAGPAQQGLFGRLMEKAQGAQQERNGGAGRGSSTTSPPSKGKGAASKGPASKTPPKPSSKRPPAKRPPADKPPSSDDG